MTNPISSEDSFPARKDQEVDLFLPSSGSFVDVEINEISEREVNNSVFQHNGIISNDRILSSSVNKFHVLEDDGVEGEIPISTRLELINSLMDAKAVGALSESGCGVVVPIHFVSQLEYDSKSSPCRGVEIDV